MKCNEIELTRSPIYFTKLSTFILSYLFNIIIIILDTWRFTVQYISIEKYTFIAKQEDMIQQ